MKSIFSKIAVVIGGTIPGTAAIADTGVPAEVGYLMNTMLLLFCGVLVMFMAPGFAMLEAGMVRSKNTAEILTKNVAACGVATKCSARRSIFPAGIRRAQPGSSRWCLRRPRRRSFPVHWPNASSSGRSRSSSYSSPASYTP